MNFFKSLFGSDKAVGVVEAKARIDSKQPVVILDVRSQSEYQSGHIPGAKLIPLNELRGRLSELLKEFAVSGWFEAEGGGRRRTGIFHRG